MPRVTLEVDLFHGKAVPNCLAVQDWLQGCPLWQRPEAVGDQDTATQLLGSLFPFFPRGGDLKGEIAIQVIQFTKPRILGGGSRRRDPQAL